MRPVELVSAWLFSVARNRIIDLFRKKNPEVLTSNPVTIAEDGEELTFEELLVSADAGPEVAYARSVLLDEIEAALDSPKSSVMYLLPTSWRAAVSKS